ncbi:hypothetical protein ACNO7L_08860 [Bisgaard Taxon 45]
MSDKNGAIHFRECDGKDHMADKYRLPINKKCGGFFSFTTALAFLSPLKLVTQGVPY